MEHDFDLYRLTDAQLAGAPDWLEHGLIYKGRLVEPQTTVIGVRLLRPSDERESFVVDPGAVELVKHP